MHDIQKAHNALNSLCEAGKPMKGFERYYADTVEMQENNDSPRLGKALNRQACQEFVDQAPDLVMQVIASAVEGTTSFTEWNFRYTAEDGTPVDYREVAVRTWQNGQIVRERFYYATA